MKTKPNPQAKPTLIVLDMPIVQPDLKGLDETDLKVLKSVVKDYRKTLKHEGFGHVCHLIGQKLEYNLREAMVKAGIEGVFEALRTKAAHNLLTQDRDLYYSSPIFKPESYIESTSLVMRNYRYHFLKCWATRLERHLEKQNGKT